MTNAPFDSHIHSLIRERASMPLTQDNRAALGMYLRLAHRRPGTTWSALGALMGVSAATASRRASTWR